MSGFELVAAIIGIFFAVGIVVGVVLVTALPQSRRHRNVRRSMGGGDWRKSPALGEDDKPPRWPGGTAT
jgi:hypothetical protein